MTSREQHDRMANAIRFLSMDAVEKANSGHPGLPMGCADIATVLFTRFLKFDPKAPHWPDRDRFILSAGHGSMLLYSLLLPDRLRGHDDRPDQAFPPAGLEDRRPSRIRPCHRHRDDDRPARPGSRQFGRLRARRAHHERRLRQRPRQPLHLCAGRRRLPDGRHQPGSHRACRPSQAQQADRLLGQQQHLDRRPGVAVRQHRPGRPLPGLRLERQPYRRHTIRRRSPTPSRPPAIPTSRR